MGHMRFLPHACFTESNPIAKQITNGKGSQPCMPQQPHEQQYARFEHSELRHEQICALLKLIL